MLRIFILFCALCVAPLGQATTALVLKVNPLVEAGKITLVGETNLPDNTELMTSITRKESSFSAGDKAKVAGGKFRAGPFSFKGQPLPPGKYSVNVTGPLVAVQPKAVRDALGRDYANFSGPAIKKTNFGTVLSVDSSVTIAGTVDPKADALGRKQQQEETWEYRRKNCMTLADTAGALVGKPPTTAQRQKITQDCLAELEADKRKAQR